MFSRLFNLLISAILLLLFIRTVDSFRAINRHYRDYYCQLESCSNPERHVLCLYPNKIAHPISCRFLIRSGLNTTQRRDLLSEHNKIRKQYTSRKNITFEQILWDDDLEEMAQRWADQCKREKDECRSIEDYGFVVKQNVGLYYVKDQTPPFSKPYHFDLSKIVKDWARTPLNPANPVVSKYEGINRIGCGVSISSDCDARRYYVGRNFGYCINYFRMYLVCNYAISQMRCYSD